MSTSTIETMIDTPSVDVAIPVSGRPAKSRSRAKPSKGTTPTLSPAQRARAQAAGHAVLWAKRYTAVAVGMSSALNAYSGAVGTTSTSAAGMIAAGAIGATVPLLVWMLGTVTAWTYRAGWARLAYLTGGIACCVLALSVVHVAGALAALTGTGLLLSSLLAIGIDVGLVASETVSVLVTSAE